MSNFLISNLLLISVFVIYLPIYLQRRKNWRIADEDLKKTNYEDWKKQMKSNAYINLISRVIWGLILLGSFAFNSQKIIASSFNWLTLFLMIIGNLSIVWGILDFRWEIKKIGEIK